MGCGCWVVAGGLWVVVAGGLWAARGGWLQLGWVVGGCSWVAGGYRWVVGSVGTILRARVGFVDDWFNTHEFFAAPL